MERKDSLEEKIKEATGAWRAPFNPDSKQKAFARVMERIGDESSGVSAKSDNEVAFPSWMKAAAIVAIVGLVSWLTYTSGKEIHTNDGIAALTVELPDGSKALLDSGAEITLNRLGWLWQRNVQLTGDAYFEVITGKSFTVKGESGIVNVLGTKFTVASTDASLFVHCSSGKVRVDTRHGSKELNAGEYSHANLHGTYAGSYLHYDHLLHTDSLTFNSAPVSLVCIQLERMFKKPVTFKLGDHLTYTGTFNTKQPDQCLEIFCKTFGARAQENQSGIIDISH